MFYEFSLLGFYLISFCGLIRFICVCVSVIMYLGGGCAVVSVDNWFLNAVG